MSGRCDRIELPLRRWVSDALAVDARAAVLMHNHPSGNTAPSRADICATRRVATLLRPIGIELLDHVIVTVSGHRSLRSMGLL